MKNVLTILTGTLLGAALIFSSTPALARPSAGALGACFANNTTGKDRKELARWVFIIMSTHPEMRDIAKTSEAMRNQADKTAANLLTRLLTKSCRSEFKAVANQNDTVAFKAAFTLLGEMAMQELMADPKVAAAGSGFSKYLDNKKLRRAIE